MIASSLQILFRERHPDQSDFLDTVGIKICGDSVTIESKIILFDDLTFIIIARFEDMESLAWHVHKHKHSIKEVTHNGIVLPNNQYLDSLKKVFKQ